MALLSDPISFTVWGLPKTKSVSHAFFHPKTHRMVKFSSKSAKAWEQLIRAQAQAFHPQTGVWLGPIRLTAKFGLPRPKSAPLRVVWPTTKPDLDKLLRAVQDALTGVIYRDDGQIVELLALKGYDDPQVAITVQPL